MKNTTTGEAGGCQSVEKVQLMLGFFYYPRYNGHG